MHLRKILGVFFIVYSGIAGAETCAPVLQITDGPVANFGPRPLSMESARTFHLVNSSTSPITLSQIDLVNDVPNAAMSFSFKNGSWQASGSCTAVLGADSSCTLTVNFKPVVLAEVQASLKASYISGGTSGTSVRPMRGTGRNAMAILAISEVAPNGFGTVMVGSSRTKDFTVTNTGELPASGLREIPPAAADPFSVENETCTDNLEPKQSCQYTIRFSPTAVGSFTGRHKIEYLQEQTFKAVSRTLTGTGAGVDHRFFVSSVSFDGNLGGVSGANAKCQQLADAAGKPGVWRALLDNPANFQIHGAVYDFKGNKIANNHDEFWRPTIPFALSTDERGNTVNSGLYAWTGIKWSSQSQSYGPATTNCSGWTSASSGKYGYFGKFTTTAYDHFSYGDWKNCSLSQPLYCISE